MNLVSIAFAAVLPTFPRWGTIKDVSILLKVNQWKGFGVISPWVTDKKTTFRENSDKINRHKLFSLILLFMLYICSQVCFYGLVQQQKQDSNQEWRWPLNLLVPNYQSIVSFRDSEPKSAEGKSLITQDIIQLNSKWDCFVILAWSYSRAVEIIDT